MERNPMFIFRINIFLNIHTGWGDDIVVKVLDSQRYEDWGSDPQKSRLMLCGCGDHPVISASEGENGISRES